MLLVLDVTLGLHAPPAPKIFPEAVVRVVGPLILKKESSSKDKSNAALYLKATVPLVFAPEVQDIEVTHS